MMNMTKRDNHEIRPTVPKCCASIPGCGEFLDIQLVCFLDELGNAVKRTTSCNLR